MVFSVVQTEGCNSSAIFIAKKIEPIVKLLLF